MIRWAAHRPAVVWSFGLAMIIAGAVSFSKLSLATKPEVELPTLSVGCSWTGAAPEVVEMYITSPIEAAIQTVKGVKKLSSSSSEGSSSITAEFDPKTDLTLAKLDIHERMEVLRKGLPPECHPSVGASTPREMQPQPLLSATVVGPYTPGTLTKMLRTDVEPRLRAVPGIGDVNVSGTAEPGLGLTYDPTKLRQLGINPAEIQGTIASARIVEPLGIEHRGINALTVRLRDVPKSIEDLNGLLLRSPNGTVFRLDDLVTIRLEEDNRGYFNRINGIPAISIDLMREPGADAILTAKNARAALEEIRKILPVGVKFTIDRDDSIDLKKQLDDLTIRGIVAFAAVMLVLALTLRNLMSIILVMGSAAVAIAGTALGLYLLDIPANMLTLAGLGMGVGILVQNGLVVVERLRHAPDTPEGRAEAGVNITPAVIGSTLTTAIVLFPFLYLQGNTRVAFLPFAAAFAIALAWSVVSSVVMIPAAGAGHGMQKKGWRRLHRWYKRSVVFVVRWRWITLATTLGLLIWVSWGFTKVKRSWWGGDGGFQRSSVSVSITFPQGSDPRNVANTVTEFEQIALRGQGVERVSAYGSPNGGGLNVVFTRDASYSALPAMMQEELTRRAVFIGGASISVQGQGPGFYNGGGGGYGSGGNFRIRLVGYSYSGVRQLALDLKERLEGIPRVRSVDINGGSYGWGGEGGGQRMSAVLDPDRAALARYGLSVSDFGGALSRELNVADEGMATFAMEDGYVPIRIKSRGAETRDIEDLKTAIIPNQAGAPLQISHLARVDTATIMHTIQRENQQYLRTLTYDFRGPQKLANKTHKAFMLSISTPPGYTAGDENYGGWRNDESGKGLYLVFAAGVFLVILSVAFVFNSTWAAWMVLLSLPVCLSGVAAIFWLTGTTFTPQAGVGVILVVGLAVNQTILLVDSILHKKKDLVGKDRRVTALDAVYAANDRAGMIVLVTLTTIASLIPLAIGTPPGSLFGSIALSTAGGTITGTIGAMWIVPAMLFWKTGKRRKRRKRKAKNTPAEASA